MPHLRSASIGLFVRAGSRFEAPEDGGLSHFLEHMLFRGTNAHPSAYELNLAIEELSTTLDAVTSSDSTVFSLDVPGANVPRAIALLGEMIREPVFGDMEVEKRIIREEILEGLDDDNHDIDPDDVVRRLLFAPHALGGKITGDLEAVERFDEADLARHLGRHYVTNNATLSVAGAFDVDAVRDSAEAAFGTMATGQRTVAEAPVLGEDRGRFVFVHDEGSQTSVRASFPTFGEGDQRSTALNLLERILDDGMSTRVHRRIIDERGLAYDAFGAVELFEDVGALDLGASVAHDKAPEALEALLDLATELRQGTVTEGELAKAKRRALWDLETLVDDPGSMAHFYGATALLQIEETPQEVAERVESVTIADVEEVARELFVPEHLHVACVGVDEGSRAEEVRTVCESWAG